ncbi:class I SAM-dependent methyltransferase [Cytobacillus depressus]|uniref:class I SAM-dependent methyltransferase n=1 Tax=Cytobacillus depressus TaxID=1602942 RepID=UPI001FE28147|nr:class I SAM-dependent methyltransferase [Cytobacillus depressus]
MVQITTSKYLDFLSKFGIGGAHPGGFNLSKVILQAEEIHRTSNILDVGCGTGQTSAYLASQYGAKVTGMDINPIMIEKAKKRISRHQLPVEIIQGSIEKCSLKDGQFDFVISESVLAFVNKPRALKEIFRLLKKGGRFIANELTVNHSLGATEKEEIKKFYGIDSVLMEKDWIALCEQTGFKHIKVHPQQNFPFHQNQSLPEFVHSENIEPDLFNIMLQHFNIMEKYRGALDYRIFTCTKKDETSISRGVLSPTDC